MSSETTSVSMRGLNIRIDENNPRDLSRMRKLLALSGILMMTGIVLCNLNCQNVIKIPKLVENTVIAPMNGVATSVFTTTLLWYSLRHL